MSGWSLVCRGRCRYTSLAVAMSPISTRATPIGTPRRAATSATEMTSWHMSATARQWALILGGEVAASEVVQTSVSTSISSLPTGRVRPCVMVYGRATLPGSSSGWSANHNGRAISPGHGEAALPTSIRPVMLAFSPGGTTPTAVPVGRVHNGDGRAVHRRRSPWRGLPGQVGVVGPLRFHVVEDVQGIGEASHQASA